ncbi:MAG: SGNH/GDSL hydrolase family protein [Verrucomicrobiales bacterium]|nr:SGNH/GDSL hydrolase family protein [Verrucomicrobiales bacterium]
MKIPTLFLSALLILSTGSAVAQNPAAPQAAPYLDLQDGDTLVFLGDSITHQCLYTQYIEDFFYTRYPDRRIRFHNAGVSGDKAADALARFEDDVAAFQPKYVTVLLGMNDGQYEDFTDHIFDTFREDMEQIGEKILDLNARPIALSPTMFDHRQLAHQLKTNPDFRFRNREFSSQYNALMAFYGAWLREEAGANNVPFVNLYGPLNDLTESQRRAAGETGQPFTLVPDAIHPEAAGQFVMAFEFLSQLTPDRRTVSSISISKRGKNWRGASGKTGEITDLVVSDEADSVSFQFQARSLPWVVPATESEDEKLKWPSPLGARTGYEMTKAGHKLSNERLKIVGLAAGKYELKIDGQSVGTFTHAQLGSKIELQSNEKTPQYQQALEVARLNRERNDTAIREVRNKWSRVKGLRRKFNEAGTPDKFETEFEKLKPEIAKLIALGREYEEKIYAAAQPKVRRYELTKVE